MLIKQAKLRILDKFGCRIKNSPISSHYNHFNSGNLGYLCKIFKQVNAKDTRLIFEAAAACTISFKLTNDRLIYDQIIVPCPQRDILLRYQ